MIPKILKCFLYENVLTIKGNTKSEREHKEGGYLIRERRSGSFHRVLHLPDTVDTEKAESRYDNSVLDITFPKVEAEKAKHLKVAVGKSLEGETK